VPDAIVISGASGLIGRALARQLAAAGHSVIALSRSVEPVAGVSVTVTWAELQRSGWRGPLLEAGAVVHLAGAGIAERRWDRARRQVILDSRVRSGRQLAEAIVSAPRRPGVFVQASAVGFYGSRGDEILTENSPSGSGFLASVCRSWEESTSGLAGAGVRRAVVRSATVLDAGAGALPKLVRPFRFGLGGRLGSGDQWFSWIHLEDEIRALRFLIEEERASGVFNLAAPEPLRNRDLARRLGRLLHRPAWAPVPAPALRLLLGGMADELLLASQRVLPQRLAALGFCFRYPAPGPALANLLV
jgi:uncharacterized protein (TIGR01777 family)